MLKRYNRCFSAQNQMEANRLHEYVGLQVLNRINQTRACVRELLIFQDLSELMSWTSYRLSTREQLVTLFLIPTSNIYIYWSICRMETWTYYRNTVAGVWFNSFNLSDPSHKYSKCYTRLDNPWMYVFFTSLIPHCQKVSNKIYPFNLF